MKNKTSKRFTGLLIIAICILFGIIFLAGAIGAGVILCIMYYNILPHWVVFIIAGIGIMFFCIAIGIIEHIITNILG